MRVGRPDGERKVPMRAHTRAPGRSGVSPRRAPVPARPPRLDVARQAATGAGSWAVPAAEIAALLSVAGNSAGPELLAAARPSTVDTSGDAAGNTPGRRAAARGPVVQRSVGLELEHNVPIYKDLPGLNQEQSLRLGSFVYEDGVVYTKGTIATKVDNTDYSHELKRQLTEYNPYGHQNQFPEKDVGIAEYTTVAPGLDELQNGAAGIFAQHVQDIKNEITLNEAAGQHQPGVWYVGLPPTIKPAGTFGALGFQATVGVFPSKLDDLHRLGLASGFIDRDLRDVQNDITGIMADLKPVIDYITVALRWEARVDGPFWDKLRLAVVRNPALLPAVPPAPVSAPKEYTAPSEWRLWEDNLQRDVIAPLLPVLDGTVRSLFRLGLSYYLGARSKVDRGQHEKNLVALLSRMELGDVFGKGGLADESVRGGVTRIIVDGLTKHDATISDVVVKHTGLYRGYPDPNVLKERSPTEALIGLIGGTLESGLGPGNVLPAPDPLDIAGKGYAEPSRPERGGAQFEYRMISTGSWDTKFIEIARQAFALNIAHLPANVQDQLWSNTGWQRD